MMCVLQCSTLIHQKLTLTPVCTYTNTKNTYTHIQGHSNTIRSMCKHMDSISESNIVDVTIPSAIPLVYDFELRPGAVYSNLDLDSKVGDSLSS